MEITKLSQVRALRKRIIVFSVPIRRRLESGLFVYNARREALFGAEDVWVVSSGNGVQEKLQPGQKGLISDGMELEPSDLDLWHTLKNEDVFKELKAFVESVDGEVRTQIIHESSLLAVYE